jgi:hypothetical protein
MHGTKITTNDIRLVSDTQHTGTRSISHIRVYFRKKNTPSCHINNRSNYAMKDGKFRALNRPLQHGDSEAEQEYVHKDVLSF